MKLAVVIPVYNSASTIPRLVKNLLDEFNDILHEVVLVNDGSHDNSEEVCTSLAETNEVVTFISLRKNFGEHNAIICGLNFINSDYVAIIDDDFQNKPSDIKKLLKIAPEHDVVYSAYPKKKQNWLRNLGSKFNDIVATQLLDKPKNLYLSSFKIIKKEIVDEIIKYKGPFPYIDGLILRVTNSIGVVEVNHYSREEGKSNYTLKKLIYLWLNMFINFSIKPIRFLTLFGLILTTFSIASIVYFIFEKLNDPSIPMGWTSLIVSILFVSGIQLIFLGIIGEYVGKQYLDKNGTPQWIIKKRS